MRTPVVIAAAVLTLVAGAVPARADVTPEQAAALGREAYLYGFPLLEVMRVREQGTSVRCPDTHGRAPVNSFSSFTRFATPNDRSVVAPNVDTLYSIAQLDLGKGPVVLRHPAMGKRYFVFQLLDPYTNTIGYIGSRTTGAKAGRFAITWAGHRGTRVKGATRIASPSRRVWVIGRTLAAGRADQRKALRLMHRYALVPPGGARRFKPGCDPGPVKSVTTPTGLAFLRKLNRGLAENPPPQRDRKVLAELAPAGIGKGLDPERAGLSDAALQALVAGVDGTAGALRAIAAQRLLQTATTGGGWAVPAANIGDYGTDYAYRAGVAALGLGANTRAEAVYPTALLDADGQPLDGHDAYRITIPKGQEPPQRAFWSLTAYDGAGYLAANDAQRYAVGSTHPPLRRTTDGAIVIAVQHTAPADPDVNWLPVPDGPFRLNLRLYEPRRAALDGDWSPPPVERVVSG